MGARKRLAPVLARLERDAEERGKKGAEALERAEWVERLSDDLAGAFALEVDPRLTNHPPVLIAQRRAHGRLIECERERAATLRGASTALWGAANETRAELAGHGTSRGMDRQRHELLGKHGSLAIATAKKHRVGVDPMMCALKPLVAKIKALKEGAGLELESDMERAAAELFGEEPAIEDVAWPPPTQQEQPVLANQTELEKARVAKKLKERKAERARQVKAAKIAKKANNKTNTS